MCSSSCFIFASCTSIDTPQSENTSCLLDSTQSTVANGNGAFNNSIKSWRTSGVIEAQTTRSGQNQITRMDFSSLQDTP